VLEGLEIQRLIEEPQTMNEAWPGLVTSVRSPLFVANCLFRSNCTPPNRVDLITADSLVCDVRNCMLLCPAEVSIGVNFPPAESLTVENCVHLGHFFVSCGLADSQEQRVAVRLTRNTIVAVETPSVLATGVADLIKSLEKPPRSRLDADGNLFDVNQLLQFNQAEIRLQPPESERFLRRVLIWQDRNNLIQTRDGPLLWSAGNGLLPAHGPKSVAEWKTFWGELDAHIVQGVVRYEGGNLASRLKYEPEKIAPADFRLRPDSAGYRAGPHGKDLGADVDLVGPGPAYERWKKTPGYQKWLEEARSYK
jgi:hypothetical protein